MEKWNELHVDMLCETMNIGAGMAASVLNEMTGEEIELSIPSVAIASREEIVKLISEDFDERLVVITQDCSNAMTGRAMLIFMEEQSMQLVKMLIDPDLDLDNLSELEAEAMAELGNIVLNACLGAIADSFSCEISIGLPEFYRCHVDAIFPAMTDAASETILVKINLKSKPAGIGGIILFVLNEQSLQHLYKMVDEAVQAVCE